MNSYLIGGYAIGIVFLWGYALLLLIESRTLARSEAARREIEAKGAE